MTDPVTFEEFTEACPDIATPVLEKLNTTKLALLGTIRRDGSPRISPIEVAVFEGALVSGLMEASHKIADLARDPRVCLMTPIADHEDVSGEGKLFCVVEHLAPESTRRFLAGVAESTGAEPEQFADAMAIRYLVRGASWQFLNNDCWMTYSWNPTTGLRVRHRSGIDGLPTEGLPVLE